MKKQKATYKTFSGSELNDLLSSSISGNSDAYIKISNQIRSIAYSYFQSKYNSGKLPNIDDADDLANNVYLAFAEQYHKIENIENWLRRVLFLTFVNWYKRKKSHQHFELNEEFHDNPVNPDVEIIIDAKNVVAILNQMSETKRNLIRLRFWNGMKFGEIAERLGKSEAAVKKMFYRLIEELKIKLE